MQKTNGTATLDGEHDAAPSQPVENGQDDSEMVATVATVAVVGVAAVAFEAALLPGIVLGVAAVALPRYFPKMGEALNPLFRSTVRGAYKLGRKTKEMVARQRSRKRRPHRRRDAVIRATTPHRVRPPTRRTATGRGERLSISSALRRRGTPARLTGRTA